MTGISRHGERERERERELQQMHVRTGVNPGSAGRTGVVPESSISVIRLVYKNGGAQRTVAVLGKI